VTFRRHGSGGGARGRDPDPDLLLLVNLLLSGAYAEQMGAELLRIWQARRKTVHDGISFHFGSAADLRRVLLFSPPTGVSAWI